MTALLAFGMAAAALGQATSGAIAIKTIAEVETQVRENGHEVRKLAPANRLVSGDEVIFTLEVRNTSALVEPPPTVTNPVPEHTHYVANSAVGPGAEVSYSVDGGHLFDRPENLKVRGANGQWRPAIAADYTHIRWQLKNSLKANSTAYARFRAIVK